MAAHDSDRKSPLILVVDNDVSVRLLERASLEKAGFHVEEADSGTTALSLFEGLAPDAILLDVMMPEPDGFTVCAKIRELPGGALTPIFMVTGLDDLESINRAFEVGATDFIAKPVNWRVLGYHVKYILRASRAFIRLQESEARNRALLNAMPDMMFRIDRDGRVLEYKGKRESDLLLPPADYVGKKLHEVLPKDIADKELHHVRKALESGEIQLFEYQHDVDDAVYHYEARLVVCGPDEVLAIIRDITERKQSEKEIVRLAYYDSLTGLPNRVLFRDRLGQAIAHTQRSGKSLAIMFLDIDHFKRVNDTLGHNVGDLLLQSVADRLRNHLRETDSFSRDTSGVEPTVARMGGDEFTILITDIVNAYDLSHIAQRICDVLSQPFSIGSRDIFISASIGITICPADSDNVDTLLKNADTAMYHAKDKGRNNFQFYTESMNAAAVERFNVTNEMRKALSNNEFQLYYQPQLNTRNGKLLGVEALIRWMHPQRGLISPGSFIPVAEETSQIVPIGEWVLQTACAQSRIWQKLNLPPIRIAVNISSVQFRQQTFVESVKRILNETGMDPHYLELELTESLIMENADSTIATLTELKNLGLHLSIDDFGTGYSSLSYLKRFPLDMLKIDRSFVKDVDKDAESAAIVRAIIAMAHHLNLAVIAEGVETEEELKFLRERGCDQAQGYLVSRPVPSDDFVKFVREERYLNIFTGS